MPDTLTKECSGTMPASAWVIQVEIGPSPGPVVGQHGGQLGA